MTISIGNNKEVDLFTSISPATSATSLSSAHSTPVKDDLLSSFTTLGDEGDDVGLKKIQNANVDVTEVMLTPPMSQKEHDINSPSSPSSKMVMRTAFVDSLISAATILLELVWPKNFDGAQIKWFLKESLRRSRSSYCTLQASLYYIYKLKPFIQSSNSLVFNCPKRCFLTCLILASKFLQDRNYSMKTWSKLSGLPLKELISMEIEILKAIDYDLNLNFELYSEWSKLLLLCTYVNNADKDSSGDESGDDIATLFSSKKQQLAHIFGRFNQKMMTEKTNATSFNVVDFNVTANDNVESSKRKRHVSDDDERLVKLIKL